MSKAVTTVKHDLESTTVIPSKSVAKARDA